MNDEELTSIRIAIQNIETSLETIAEPHKPVGVAVRASEIRDEWRRRYAGVALEGLLAARVLATTCTPGVIAERAVEFADALLAALDKPAGS